MNVEKAGIGDIDALVQLRLAYLREDFGTLADSDADAVKKGLPGYFLAHLNRDLFVYMIREGPEIVSCAFLLVIRKPMSPAFLNGMTGTVMNVYTVPSSRRKGYAGGIIRKLLDEAKEMELSVVELKSTEDGYPLYLSAGFSDDRSKYHLMKWKKP